MIKRLSFCSQESSLRIIYLAGSWGFPGGSDGIESACNAGDLGSTPGLGRYPGEGNDYPLQYSALENCTLDSINTIQYKE